MAIAPKFLRAAKRLGKEAAEKGLAQENMAIEIVKFRKNWTGKVPAEMIEEFLIEIAAEYYRSRPADPFAH
jgi:hypothetical protein